MYSCCTLGWGTWGGIVSLTSLAVEWQLCCSNYCCSKYNVLGRALVTLASLFMGWGHTASMQHPPIFSSTEKMKLIFLMSCHLLLKDCPSECIYASMLWEMCHFWIPWLASYCCDFYTSEVVTPFTLNNSSSDTGGL